MSDEVKISIDASLEGNAADMFKRLAEESQKAKDAVKDTRAELGKGLSVNESTPYRLPKPRAANEPRNQISNGYGLAGSYQAVYGIGGQQQQSQGVYGVAANRGIPLSAGQSVYSGYGLAANAPTAAIPLAKSPGEDTAKETYAVQKRQLTVLEQLLEMEKKAPVGTEVAKEKAIREKTYFRDSENSPNHPDNFNPDRFPGGEGGSKKLGFGRRGFVNLVGGTVGQALMGGSVGGFAAYMAGHAMSGAGIGFGTGRLRPRRLG